MSEELDLEPFKVVITDCHRIGTSRGGVAWSKVGDDIAALIAEVERLRAQLLAVATPEGPRKESTLQRLTRCRAVLNMHGVLTKVENSNILLRIVGNYSEFLPAPPAPASGEKP